MTHPQRIPPTEPDERDDESRAVIDNSGGLNIFATLAHHPKLMKRWLVFGNHVLNKSTLPARERELLILRVGWRCNADYEFGQHTGIGKEAGVTDEEIRRLAAEPIEGWSDADAALVRAADELVADHRIGDATWADLSARWTTEQLMDIVFAAGQYVLVSMALNTLGVQREEGVPGFPQ